MRDHVSILYFSPTGNTRKTLEAMAAAIGRQIEDLDLTCSGDAASRAFDENDFVLLGAPVYAGRIPSIARDRLAKAQGRQTPCLVVVSYGNRDYDDALLELSDLAKSRGFVVMGAAAVIGRHTYGEIQTTRPDADDLAQDRAFAEKAAAGSEAPDLQIPGNRPYKDGGAGGRFRPSTTDACTHCGLCVRSCPVQAIAENCADISDSCISCFRCIRSCPAHAKQMDTEEYRSFAEMFTKKLAPRRENQYFL